MPILYTSIRFWGTGLIFFSNSCFNVLLCALSCRECQNSGHDYCRPPTSPSPNRRKTLKLCWMSSSSMTPQETQAGRSTSAFLQVRAVPLEWITSIIEICKYWPLFKCVPCYLGISRTLF